MLVAISSSASARWYASRVAPAPRRVDPHDVEVQRVRVARVARERRDPVEPGEALVVERELARADLARARSSLSSWTSAIAASTSERFALKPARDLVVVRAVAAAREPHVPDRLGDVVAVRRDEPALAGGDVLRRVEREAGRVGEPAELAAAVPALERVGGVLDDGQAEREDRIEVARLAGEVDGQDRLRPLGDERRERAPGRCSGRPRGRRRRPASRRSARSRSPSRAR